MYRSTLMLFLLIGSMAWAAPSSHDFHRTQMDKKVKSCPKDVNLLAKEVLEAELAGLRWNSSKVSCFESLKMKYVHVLKTPDARASKLIKVKRGSLEIEAPVYDEKFYSYNVSFSVENEKGKKLKSNLSFMLNAELGGAKPKQGCVLVSSSPEQAYVYEDCL